ncbi:NAD(P)H-binding protein [Arthrobacter sp. Bz4]|uniref:SDR family oxidoreductase n=1 Tax=Arthrobacter sp. Bz4 TaxID=2171979 RepID=UPI000D506ECC|nr:NAD(P)H-binding protein [Arthrobacter sp. Bz4]PVE19569.1 NmrA family transcriptional regulator [Arthrobacter sp. Bz4]
MMRVVVVGGTGLVGHHLVDECVRRGHQTRSVSRHLPAHHSPRWVAGAEHMAADVTTGEGLTDALAEADVLIDVLDGQFGKGQRALDDGALNLLTAAREAGIARAVVLSIVNCDLAAFSYYRAKVRQEKIYQNSSIPSVVVRATQFHNFLTVVFDGGRKAGVLPVLKNAVFQPIAVQDVAGALADAATHQPIPQGTINVGGPQVLEMAELARIYRDVTGATGRQITLPLPGALGKFFSSGENLARDSAVNGLTFEAWLRLRSV